MSARLCVGERGQPLAVVTVNTLPQLEQRHAFRVLNVDAALGSSRMGDRRPSRSSGAARNPFQSKPWRQTAAVGGALGYARE
jgi:hypothetical protein